MAKPGYYSSIEGLGGWFNAPGNAEYNEFAILSTDEKGQLLYRWKAPDHEKAWDDCQEKLRGFNGGLYWIRFYCKKGTSAVGTGLELSHIPTASNVANHIGGVSNVVDLELQKRLWRFEYEEQKAKESPSLVNGFLEILKSNPETSKEFFSGINNTVGGLLGLLASFIPAKNQGVGIAGAESGNCDYVRFGNRRITECGEVVIKCKSFSLLNESDDEVLFDGVRLPYGCIEYSHIPGTKGYNQKAWFSGENVNVLMTYLE